MYLANPDCLWVACNLDKSYPFAQGVRTPANGATCALLSTATGRQPDIVAGKPSLGLTAALMEEYGLEPSETVFIGDTVDTDIEFANNSGFESLLVLSGNATENDALNPATQLQTPTYFAPSVKEVYAVLTDCAYPSSSSSPKSRL